MTHSQLTSLLEGITGSIRTTGPSEEKALERAQQKIALSFLQKEVPDTGSEQLFAHSDLYAREKISAHSIKSIASIADRFVKAPPKEEELTDNFFIRTVPVLNPEIAGSQPEWAIGARPIETIGPFLNNEGREIWIDFYRIEKLITLYIGAQPVLLFKAVFRQPRLMIIGGSPVELTTTYTLVAGSCWIHAQLFNTNVPSDKFAGVKITGGSINLSKAPVVQNNRLTLDATTTIDVALNLVQTPEAAANTSDYGKDAGNATYHLPLQWNFTIRNSKATNTAIGSSSCTILGQATDFNYQTNAATLYDRGKLLIPWTPLSNKFEVMQSASPWLQFSGKSTIKAAGWGLPVASLNINNPVQAAGNGAVVLRLNKGISSEWTGLNNEDARLISPIIVGEPGELDVIDMGADISGASQQFDLWKDDKNKYGATADLLYKKKSTFIFSSRSKDGQEILGSLAAAKINADRPVKVNGEAFPVRTDSCVVLLTASAAKRNVYLYEDKVEENPSDVPPVYSYAFNLPLRKESIALENALFTVSPVAAFMLFGECNEEWIKVTRANFFLSFALYSYLPTLPDPYVGNLSIWKRLFERLGNSSREGNTGIVLICAVRYYKENEDKDAVTVGFHFGANSLQDMMTLPEKPQEDTGVRPAEPAQPAEPARPAERIKSARPIITDAIRNPILGKELLTKTTRFGQIKNTVRLDLGKIGFGKIPDAVKVPDPIPAPQASQPEPYLDADLKSELINSNGKPYSYEELRKLGKNTTAIWDDALGLNNEYFALLDISSNANQLGVSFSTGLSAIKTGDIRRGQDGNYMVAQNNNPLPFIVDGMEVKLPGQQVRTFTLPLSAWEPTINQSEPDRETPSSPKLMMDPEKGILYYPNDGGASRFWNNNSEPVALAPIPRVNALLEDFKKQPGNFTVGAFTLPFGMKALSYVSKHFTETVKPDIRDIRPKFRKAANNEYALEGGIQLSFRSGNFGKKMGPLPDHDSKMFPGYTFQLNNLRDLLGRASFASNLGHRVTEIFNNEFLISPLNFSPLIKESRGVPVTRMDVTGYGANMFSNWLSPTAAIAQTSQARFDVMMGRTGHEVIQVKSILYPWGIRVVRTITVFRTASGYVFRQDSGWKAESDGQFDFSYKYMQVTNRNEPNSNNFNYQEHTEERPYEIHPGMIKGLYNIRNIKDAASVTEYEGTTVTEPGKFFVYGVKGEERRNDEGAAKKEFVKCGAVYFDADVEIENVVQGSINGTTEKDMGGGNKVKYGRVVSKRILGYVQVAPPGVPLTAEQFRDLLLLQNGSIGGDLDCAVNIASTNQQMNISRFDVSVSINAANNKPVFVAAARGQVLLPKDGSWSIVQHNAGSGEVTQLPGDTMVPLIRKGEWVKEEVISATNVKNELARIAHPLEILRAPGTDTINFGYLQITGTQKALFLTPAYGLGPKRLLSKTPPIFADAYRLMTGNNIFPNIGNAIDNFGKAMPLHDVFDAAGNAVKGFADSAFNDGTTKALEVMDILSTQSGGGAVIEQGMKMLQKKADDLVDKALDFVVPQLDEPIYLVDAEALKIYIDFNAKPKDGARKDGRLGFDVNSFAGEMEKQWKSRLSNVSMNVDLGDMKQIIIIKGNFDSKKGKESNYEGGPDADSSSLPTPEIEFGPDLKPVVDILTVLASLSTGNYAEAMKKGLKIAMSNSGEIWEYKFEASKELPLVRFPPTDELYNSAQTPLKLEASMGIGVYFNAALKVTTDPGTLLPTAGAFLKFHGGLSVMCVSVGVGTIYAVGSVDVKIGADTRGASLALKFGFGVQLVVSLPVLGSVSVTYMVGIEMSADRQRVVVAAMMLFRGHASLVGGLVSVTITIEAKGIIVRELGADKTECSAQVTFALDISIFLIIDISFSKTWGETRQIA